jgi:hypothetical protein
MKHRLVDDANVNVNVDVDLPIEELGELVDKIVDGVVTVIAVATVAHIFRNLFE